MVQQIRVLSLAELQPLMTESEAEGYTFLRRMAAEYADGKNRFDRPGEALFGIYEEGQLVAVGGLNRDPYLPEDNVGRVRHVYVAQAWRRRGAGRRLMQQIVTTAVPHFRLLTLRTMAETAAAFYRSLGFAETETVPHATHVLVLSENGVSKNGD